MTRFLPLATALWGLAYGALRATWALFGAPDLPPVGHDLVVFTGLGPAALCLAASGIAIGLRLTAYSRWLVAAAGAVVAALAVADALLLLDVVGILTGGVHGAAGWAALASRAGCAVLAALLAASAVAYRRRGRAACGRCGRTEDSRAWTRVPGWARAGAWLAVAGCLVRIGAQIAVGFDGMPLTGSLYVFEGGFLLAGTLLPLALAYRFGRVWPRWVVPLAGRRVPRWLVLGPGLLFSTGLLVYFGIALVQMTADAVAGRPQVGLPDAFFWTAVPAYWLWGLGMGAAAIAYLQVTRPACAACGRGESRLTTWSPSHTSARPERSAKQPYAA